MKLLLDFFPVVLFFVAYKFSGIYMATVVAIVGTLLQLAYAKFVLKRVEPMLWASLAIVVVFGGLTLALQNPTFIKWKPTVLYWAMAVGLGISALSFKRNMIRKMLEQQVTLPEPVWARLNTAWIVFFALMGAINLLIAYNFSEETWVNFKLFGGMGLMLLFVLGQGLFLSRHIKDEAS